MARPSLLILSIALMLSALIGCAEDVGDPYDKDDADDQSDDPSRYHGAEADDPFFEGWYLNVNEPSQGRSFVLIVAALNPNRTSDAFNTAFVVLADMTEGSYISQLFSVDDFAASDQGLSVDVAQTVHLDIGGTSGCIESEGRGACWELALTNLLRWEETMGALTNTPGMEMNWDVWMLNGRAAGWVEYAGARSEFNSAAAYGDHNWGAVFPDQYIWGQADHFPNNEDCLAFSGGDVRLGDITLKGYMLGYRRGAEFFQVRSQDGDLLKHTYADGVWVLEGIEGNTKLVVTGVADPASLVRLPAPRPEGLAEFAAQTLQGTITVEVFGRNGLGWKLIDSNSSAPAGMENGGS